MKTNEQINELINRLNCRYAIGPMINGEPEFGYRDVSGPAPEGMMLPTPIDKEAAEIIRDILHETDRLTALLTRAEKTKQTLAEECERLTERAATHLADQDLLVAMERKRVAREIANFVGEFSGLGAIADRICEKYGVTE